MTTINREIETVGISSDGGFNYDSKALQVETTYDFELEDSVVDLGEGINFSLKTLKALVKDAEYVASQEMDEE